MGDFFRGWRRKIGLASLVLAAGVLGLWIRSHSVNDILCLPTGLDDDQVFVSDRSGLIWLRMHHTTARIGDEASHPHYQHQPATKSGFLKEFLFAKWTFQKAGFQLGSGEEYQPGWGGTTGGNPRGFGMLDLMLPMEPKFRAMSIVVIPNWFVVLLLTIAAGILIFRRHPDRGLASPPIQTAPEKMDGKS